MAADFKAGTIRMFAGGATRDTEDGKLDFDGFLSPAVLTRFSQYMHQHRVQTNGQLRDSANWQMGMPLTVYMKSMWRHFMDVWRIHWGLASISGDTLEDVLCALLFNVQGYLFEVLKAKSRPVPDKYNNE